MKAISAVFDYGSKNHYERLARVLEKSWAQNSSIPLEVLRIKAPEVQQRHISFYSNTKKLKIWREQFDQDTIFVDADMLCLRDPAVGFDYVDDIGLTDRSSDLPINGGVMFVKYTKCGKRFMKDFEEVNTRMLENVEFHKEWQGKYAGINQSAIGYLIETKYTGYDLLPEKFNLCDDWEAWRGAYLVHIKGHLRKLCLRRRNRRRARNPMSLIVSKWKEFEDQ